MQEHPYFQTDSVSIFAHRGQATPTENTLEAFILALAAGADYLETDVRTTKDQIAVLFHDKTLKRLTGVDKEIADLTWAEVKSFKLEGGGTLTSLDEALTALPQARFNLDLKDSQSVKTAVNVIETNKAHSRVLVSSFSNGRREAALKLFTLPVATSASASTVIKIWLLALLRAPQSLINKALRNIGALQIPRSQSFMRLDSKRFIHSVLASGTLIHYWTINSPDEMLELTRLGASGIVTDVPELAVRTLRKA
jgi:glycerophosphoryl diester phosphodiesterase